MRIIDPGYEILFLPDPALVLTHLERAGRTCYKSEARITPDSAPPFIERLLRSGHESVIEHMSITVRFVCDRGVTHELVRHRLASYSQESTRYANYARDQFGNEITVIRPPFWAAGSPPYEEWRLAMQEAEARYMTLLAMGARPEEARSVLPNSLKTEIVMTANIREWRHVFRQRCAAAAHPQIRQIMLPLLRELHARLPVLFQDVYEQFTDAVAALPAAG